MSITIRSKSPVIPAQTAARTVRPRGGYLALEYPASVNPAQFSAKLENSILA